MQDEILNSLSMICDLIHITYLIFWQKASHQIGTEAVTLLTYKARSFKSPSKDISTEEYIFKKPSNSKLMLQ